MTAQAVDGVRILANAYRATLRRGDTEFAGNALERKLLLAVVAASAEKADVWVRTRMTDGTVAAAPLEELLPALQEIRRAGGESAALRSGSSAARPSPPS